MVNGGATGRQTESVEIGHCVITTKNGRHEPVMAAIFIPYNNTVDLVIFARFQFSRISRGEQIREFRNRAKIIIIIALLEKNENSRILNFAKSPKIGNSRKFKHAKITRSTVCVEWSHGTPEIATILDQYSTSVVDDGSTLSHYCSMSWPQLNIMRGYRPMCHGGHFYSV